MLGTGKIKIATANDDFEAILTDLFAIQDSSKFTANMRAKDVVAKKGGNRSAMSDARASEIAESEDALDFVREDISLPYIRRICAIISKFTSEFKRKCAVGFFMAQGTTMRYPEDFKLAVDTEDQVRNIENENLNTLISNFSDKLENDLLSAVQKLNNFLSNLPEPIAKAYSEKSYALFDPKTETGNIYKDIRRTYRDAGLELTDDVMESFREVVLAYREAKQAYTKPGIPRVGLYFGMDNGILLRTARDALQPIIDAIPTVIVTDIVENSED